MKHVQEQVNSVVPIPTSSIFITSVVYNIMLSLMTLLKMVTLKTTKHLTKVIQLYEESQ